MVEQITASRAKMNPNLTSPPFENKVGSSPSTSDAPIQKENCSAKNKENANGPKSHETEGGIATDAVEDDYMEEEDSVDAMTKKSALSINVTEAKATDETKVDRANISSSETVENKTKEDESMERNHANESVLQNATVLWMSLCSSTRSEKT